MRKSQKIWHPVKITKISNQIHIKGEEIFPPIQAFHIRPPISVGKIPCFTIYVLFASKKKIPCFSQIEKETPKQTNNCENHSGEFDSQKSFIEQNKPLFKYRGRKKNIKKPERINQKPLMNFPSKLTEAIKSSKVTDLRFLISKKLKETDIDKYQNRIYVSKRETLMGYLSEYEKHRIEKQGIEGGLVVNVIGPRGKIYGMKMKLWESCNKYALIKEWGKMVRDIGLKKDDMVEIWCFRVDFKLHLVVNALTLNLN